MSGILGALFDALFGALLGWLRERRAEDALRDAGAADQAGQTYATIAEMADDRSALDAAAAGTARDVARRLRDRLDRTAGAG